MFTQTHRSGPFVTAILLLGLIAAAIPVQADLITGSEYVSGSRYSAAYGGYGSSSWFYRYMMGFDGKTVTAQVQVELVFHSSVQNSDQEKAAWKTAAEAAIEEKWNDEYTFEYDDVTIAAAVDVAYDGPFNQTVYVMPDSDSSPTTMNTWHWGQGDMTSAHEFGHMLGLYDEYWGGALSPDDLLDNTALMGNVALSDPEMPPRYYQPFRDFAVALQIPEPATTTMLISAVLTGLALLRRRNKQKQRLS